MEIHLIHNQNSERWLGGAHLEKTEWFSTIFKVMCFEFLKCHFVLIFSVIKEFQILPFSSYVDSTIQVPDVSLLSLEHFLSSNGRHLPCAEFMAQSNPRLAWRTWRRPSDHVWICEICLHQEHTSSLNQTMLKDYSYTAFRSTAWLQGRQYSLEQTFLHCTQSEPVWLCDSLVQKHWLTYFQKESSLCTPKPACKPCCNNWGGGVGLLQSCSFWLEILSLLKKSLGQKTCAWAFWKFPLK